MLAASEGFSVYCVGLLILVSFLCFLLLSIFGRFLGNVGSAVVAVTVLVFLNILNIFILVGVVQTGTIVQIVYGTWVLTIGIGSDWSILVDSLSVEMSFIILLITTVVVIYTISYMGDDPHLVRFLSYLILFMFFMLMLVLSGNLIQLFIGWEGVGLVSYLLVNFWFTRLEANRSAIKAIVFNRVGDIGFVVACVLIINLYSTSDFATIFIVVEYGILDANSVGLNELICLCLVLGAAGKSAQIGLHAWLPDAMEGPTPVSALLHSATMVTAGIFVMLRFSPVFIEAYNTMVFIAIVGCLTTILGATVAMFQYDLKKIIAYSTCSQLGFMLGAFGVCNLVGSFFHLINHAFFKALLFLTAGSIIHALNDEQDVRRMGGLLLFLPLTSLSMLVGFLGLTGFPFLSGFYSKEIILFGSLGSFCFVDRFVGLSLLVASICTALYSSRVLYLVVYSQFRGYRIFTYHLVESDGLICLPLLVLSIFTFFGGFINEDRFVGVNSSVWFKILPYHNDFILLVESETGGFGFRLLLILLIILGIGFYVIFYNKFGLNMLLSFNIFYTNFKGGEGREGFFEVLDIWLCSPFLIGLKTITDFFTDKWWFSVIYRRLVFCYNFLAYTICVKLLDRGVIERFLSIWGVGALFRLSGISLILDNHKIETYLFVGLGCFSTLLFFFLLNQIGWFVGLALGVLFVVVDLVLYS